MFSLKEWLKNWYSNNTTINQKVLQLIREQAVKFGLATRYSDLNSVFLSSTTPVVSFLERYSRDRNKHEFLVYLGAHPPAF